MRYLQCKDYIRSDYYRIRGRKDDGIFRMFFATFIDVGFRFLFWFRLAKCHNIFVSSIARPLYRHIGMKHGIDIERETNMGYGIRIAHGGPVVINVSANIGNNVDICQFSTIGSVALKAATIGNNVYIGPSVSIVENVNIGDGVTIGAGAVVTKNIRGGETVAGNPAKVISHKEPGRLVYKKWNMAWNKA